MSNMSYCRFENTNYDLVDCRRHIDETGLSESELRARAELISECVTIIEDLGGSVEWEDHDSLADCLQSLAKKNSEEGD